MVDAEESESECGLDISQAMHEPFRDLTSREACQLPSFTRESRQLTV